jgi:threonine dehydrogenase-like Zn-dependent dehydrogenase
MPATNVWHLDDNVSFDIGGIHDPMGNAFHTVLTADIPGSTVLVTGCGPIGIFAVGICKAAGASRIIASDVNDTRLALAKQMGAHDIVHPSEADAVVKQQTDGLIPSWSYSLRRLINQRNLIERAGIAHRLVECAAVARTKLTTVKARERLNRN